MKINHNFENNFIFQYYNKAEQEAVLKAYEFAKKAHAGQKRANGKPYIVHPLGVVEIVLDLQVLPEIAKAALLHDVLEDTPIKFADLEKEFGFEVARLVNAVSKSRKIQLLEHNSEEERKALHRLFLETIKDPKSALVKMADRLNNMRTLDNLTLKQQERISRETIKVYVPLANEMGLPDIASELHDLAKKYLSEEKYQHAMSLSEEYKKEIQEKGYHKDAIKFCVLPFS